MAAIITDRPDTYSQVFNCAPQWPDGTTGCHPRYRARIDPPSGPKCHLAAANFGPWRNIPQVVFYQYDMTTTRDWTAVDPVAGNNQRVSREAIAVIARQ
jgi:hypothetical protein